jgi:hypothetical protein
MSDGPRNLLDRIRGNYEVVRSTVYDTEPTIETQDDLLYTDREISPSFKPSVSTHFLPSDFKLNSASQLNRPRTLCLFDFSESYKRHLMQMQQKKEERSLVIEARWPKGLISPDNRLKQVWNFLAIFLLLYTFILTPYLIAFEEVEIGSSWFFVDVFVDCCFFVDIFITLNSAYPNSDGELVISRKEIFMNYLKGMLIIDFLSVFPFYLIGDSKSSRSNVFIRFLRMARLTRIFRASKIINIVKHVSSAETMASLVRFLKSYSGVTRLFTAINVVLLITHFTACMWFYSARLDDFSPDTWVVRNNLLNSSKSQLYLSSLYWALTTLTTVGFGDIHAYTMGEMIICMLWMMFGVGFYSFTVGTLSSMLSSIDAKSSMINGKLGLIELFAKDTRLPDDLLKKVTKVVRTQAESVTLDDKQRQALLMQLPKTMRYEIAMTMHNCSASKVDFFKVQETAFVANIVPLMQYVTVSKDEFVYHKGDHPEDIYFVVSGRINFVYSEQNTIFKTIVSGSYFGEIELLDQVPRSYGTMTEKDCEFLLLSKQLLDFTLKEYPKVADRLRVLAQERKERDLAAQHELEKLLERVNIRKEFTLAELAGTTIR